jgi:hypothetical protein
MACVSLGDFAFAGGLATQLAVISDESIETCQILGSAERAQLRSLGFNDQRSYRRLRIKHGSPKAQSTRGGYPATTAAQHCPDVCRAHFPAYQGFNREPLCPTRQGSATRRKSGTSSCHPIPPHPKRHFRRVRHPSSGRRVKPSVTIFTGREGSCFPASRRSAVALPQVQPHEADRVRHTSRTRCVAHRAGPMDRPRLRPTSDRKRLDRPAEGQPRSDCWRSPPVEAEAAVMRTGSHGMDAKYGKRHGLGELRSGVVRQSG